jgi:multidrug efflux pump subunit AcrA (membrane-fusion protein)
MTSPHSLNRRYRFFLPVLMLISSNPALPVSNPVEQVTLAGPYLIAVQPGSLIEKKLVSAGQACEARFYGLPHQLFRGVVRSIAPALFTEHRTLRIFFELNDQQGQLKPGMYADIGLGMDPRWTRLTPSDAVLHIGESDYVLTEAGLGLWRITTVQVGERLGSRVEILDGLKNGQKIVGNGAILLKSLVVKALLTAKETGTGDAAP